MAQARLIVEELKQLGITHLPTVPDNSSKALLEQLAAEKWIQVLPVTREGEAFAMAAGLWVGGATPAVLIQNTGLLESGDALRGTALRMRVPLLCLITYRGFAKLARSGLARTPEGLHPDLISRADLDSVALLTEPTLRAWNVPFDFLHEDKDVSKISAAFQKAQKLEQPAAVLITGDTT